MAVHVGKMVFADWQALKLPGGWSDTFIFPVSYQAGLPPGDYPAAIRRMALQIVRLRRSASLWIPTDAPGAWFAEELRQRLRGLILPFAVTRGNEIPILQDFSFFPWTDRLPSPPPPAASPIFQADVSALAVKCLRVLARIQQGYAPEIASLAGVSPPTAREALQELAAKELIIHVTETDRDWKYPSWAIQRSGVSQALRSWGLPAGISFEARKERGNIRTRPRRTARLWPAWVRQAWPDADIWTGWTEVNLGNPYPDALCWGRVAGYESLVWLEVERGNHLTVDTVEALRSKFIARFNRALVYVRRFPTGSGTRLHLVFAVLGPERVLQVAREAFSSLPQDAAVLIADWKAFGKLPRLSWGRAQGL